MGPNVMILKRLESNWGERVRTLCEVLETLRQRYGHRPQGMAAVMIDEVAQVLRERLDELKQV